MQNISHHRTFSWPVLAQEGARWAPAGGSGSNPGEPMLTLGHLVVLVAA